MSTGRPTPWTRHLPLGTDPAVDLLARGTLPRAWVDQWRVEPDRPVLADEGGRWWSGGDLLDATADVAVRLRGAGLAVHERVLLSGPTSTKFVTAYIGALRAGLVVVPVNPGYTERELETIAQDARPAGALLADVSHRRWAARALPEAVVTDLDVDLPAGQSGGLAPAIDETEPGAPALLPYTSGTTGAPKGALLSHANLLASAEAVRLAWRWSPQDCLLLCLPLFHMHGLGVGLHGTLLSGARALLRDGFDAEWVLARAEEGAATMFFGVPTMYGRLASTERPQRLGRLRLCVSGSAPLSADLHRDIAARARQVVLERYGMTETVMLVSNPYDGERRPGTVGWPLPGVELRLEDGGEIEVRGHNVFAGYFERPEATAASFTADGWFRTGDIGAVDDDGYVRIVGRAKELIISGGYNVYPREVEDVLRRHPQVRDAAVVGTPSPEWGEIVTAYVEADAGLDEADVLAFAASELAAYKRPRAVHRVDALPRNRLGKVVRGQLRPPPAPAR